MEKEKWARKRVVAIRIEPYLAEYISAKYASDTTTGGVKIPYSSDLYFCIWELDVIYDFIRTYQLKSISSDALLKNYYRFRNRLRPKKARHYNKSSRK